jgi:hypothetical protein
MTRPGETALVGYLYDFSADTTSLGCLGNATSTPVIMNSAFFTTNYMVLRLNADATGTFASAPIFTAYLTTGHGAITRGDNSLLGGNTTDTGATARSYLKGNMYGIGATVQVPSTAPVAPTVTDGTTGSVSPTTAAWLNPWQSLQGDNDYITYGSVPTATTAQVLALDIALFVGPNQSTGTATPVISTKYTYA